MKKSTTFFIIIVFAFSFTNCCKFSQIAVYYPLDSAFNTIEYDIQTKTETIVDEVENIPTQEKSIPPFSDNVKSILQLSYPFPPDDRVRIDDTTTFPWSTICKLYIVAADDTQWIGSGAIIDEFHVLTCGHCVYLHDHGGWASEISVIPGMAWDYEPFGRAYATLMRSYSGWVDDQMEEHDWAVLTLDSTIGSQTGWMGRSTADASDPMYTDILNTAGYPGDLDYGGYIYFDSDLGEDANEYLHWFWMDTAGGQSGSPVWIYDGENRYIISIVAYEYENGTYANFGTRLDQDKYDRINTWLSEDPLPGTNNHGGQAPNIALVVVPVIIGAVGLAGVITIIIYVKRKSARKVKEFDYMIPQESTPESPLQVQDTFIKFCPMCGCKIFRESQRFCTDCGFTLQDEVE